MLRVLASALTAMFVRYNVIGGRETTVMESTVYEVAAKLRKTKDFDAAVSALADLAPDPEDFVARFQRASVSRIATARYLLREIEHAKRRTQEVAVEGTDRVHVERIYPQTPDGPKWPNHAQVINRLGNLTLLGKRLNTSIKNADFATKKKDGYASSDILMTKELLSLDTWDAAAIDERQRELSGWVFEIWKFPERPLHRRRPSRRRRARTTRSWSSSLKCRHRCPPSAGLPNSVASPTWTSAGTKAPTISGRSCGSRAPSAGVLT